MISDDDRREIKTFIGNQRMVAAVLRILLPAEPITDALDSDLDDAEYGRAMKAWIGARKLVTDRFDELRRIASSNPQPEPINGAR